jgi:hypothetical protein
VRALSWSARTAAEGLLLALAALATAGCSPAPDRTASADSALAILPDTIRTGEATDSTDPARVIRDYYDAINRRDFHTAYLLWGDSGRSSGKTLDEFRAGYTGTDSAEVALGAPGRVEGAAGSRYVEVPVTLHAWTHGGGEQQFAGSYVLRRTVVDGATDAQRRWHIYSADIH